MIVVVASAYDTRALRIVAHWGSQSAAILSAEDLCKPGWVLRVPWDPAMTAVIGGIPIPAAEISGFLTLRPCIQPEELHNIGSTHRKYVASELNAFLLAWLSAQPCPLLNRPTASCLAGPNWRPEQWALTAARLGIASSTCRRIPADEPAADDDAVVEITTVAGHCFGDGDSVLMKQTTQLARAAGVELLSARFSPDGGRLLSANPWPSLTDPDVLAAVRQRLVASA